MHKRLTLAVASLLFVAACNQDPTSATANEIAMPSVNRLFTRISGSAYADRRAISHQGTRRSIVSTHARASASRPSTTGCRICPASASYRLWPISTSSS